MELESAKVTFSGSRIKVVGFQIQKRQILREVLPAKDKVVESGRPLGGSAMRNVYGVWSRARWNGRGRYHSRV